MTTAFAAAVVIFASGSLEASAGAGVASNAFELPNDAAALGATRPRPALIVPLTLDGEIDTGTDRALRVGAVAALRGTFHPAVAQDPDPARKVSALDANRFDARVGLPAVLDLEGPLGVTFEPFASAHYETYTSHRTGRPLVASGVPLGERYNANRGGARLEGEWSTKRARLDLELRATRADHLEDYVGTTQDSWDHTEWRIDADALLGRRGFLLGAGYSWTRRDYDERFPHEEDGDEVTPGDPGFAPQVFTWHRGDALAGWRSRGVLALLRVEATRRLDEFEGYLDYSETGVSTSARVTPGSLRLRGEAELSWRRYDHARVALDPTEPQSTRRRASFSAEVEWPASARSRGFVEISGVDQRSTNELFTYRDLRGVIGARVVVR